MDSNSIASALGISGVSVSVLMAIAWAIARSCKSKCVLFGTVIDVHPATQEEQQASQGQTTHANESNTRDSVIQVHVHTPGPSVVHDVVDEEHTPATPAANTTIAEKKQSNIDIII